MKLQDAIYCTFGGGGGDQGSSTAPIGQHPEHDGTWDRNKMRKGGPDKAGVVAEGKAAIVCFDFDGVLAEYDGWKGSDVVGEPKAKSVSLAQKLHSEGYKIVVLTARKKLSVVQKWLKDNGLGFAKATNIKPPAAAYIDDKAIRWPTSEALVRSKLEAAQNTDPDTQEFIQKTNPALLAKSKKKNKMRATSGGQSEGSSLTSQNFYVVDGAGRILHTFRTREEAEQASAGNRYSKVVTHVEQATPAEETPEVRDTIRRRPGDTQVRVFRRTLPFPGSPYPSGPTGR